jgi:DNA relaxase NicK
MIITGQAVRSNNCLRREKARSASREKMQNSVILDYFSFTWCPEQLNTIRNLARIAARSEDPKLKHMKNLSGYIRATMTTNEISLLDDDCYRNLLDFLTINSKSFFSDSDQVVDAWEEVFVVRERGQGMFGYSRSWDLYFNGQSIGVAASGAKNGGCYVSLTGKGCSLIDFEMLHAEIKGFPNIRITRSDFAFDDYEGRFSVATARKMYINRSFSSGGRYPEYQYFEGGCLDDRGKKRRGKLKNTLGSTFNVGKRENGKMIRIYEKGKQLGDKLSKWVRWEVELRSSNREIPLWVMLKPADYFAAAYPATAFISEYQIDVQPTVVMTKKRTVVMTYERALDSLHRVGGALINVMRESKGLSDSEIINQLIGSPESCPVSLRKVAF